MNWDEINVLKDWVSQRSEFNKNDLLVSIHTDRIVPFSPVLKWTQVQKIIANSQNSLKESGINPFCTTRGLLHWSYQSTEIRTPIFIIPTAFKIDRVRKNVELSPLEQEKIINPFLIKKMAQLYHISIPELEKEADLFEFLFQHGFTTIDKEQQFVGNFHHHRFAVLKDLESIIEKKTLSENLVHYIGGDQPKSKPIRISSKAILNYDSDHRKAFQAIEQENCVIQGPPGTGKSQLLTNLIAKSLACQKSQLVVSEKKAALEVIQKRLATRNLDTFAIMVNDGINSHDFLDELKKTWEALESYQVNKKPQLSTFKELSDNLQMTLEILGQPALIGGIDFTQFNSLKKNLDLSHFHFLATVPSVTLYIETLDSVAQLYKEDLQKVISKISFSFLHTDKLTHLSKEIEALKSVTHQLNQITHQLTPAQLDEVQFKTVILQLFDNEIARKHLSILRPHSKAQVQFQKHYKKYRELEKAIQSKEHQLTHWHILPSTLETESLLEQFESSSFFKKIKRNKRWNQLSTLPTTKAKAALEELKNLQKLQEKMRQVEHKLTALGIEDFSELHQINASIPLFSDEKWELHEQMSSDIKLELLPYISSLEKVKLQLKHVFHLEPTTSIASQITLIENGLPALIAARTHINKLTYELYFAISKSENLEAYQRNVIGTHQSTFSAQYPSFSSFKLEEIKTKLKRIVQEEKQEQKLFSEEIWTKIKNDFIHYHLLLNTPSSKLNETEKQLKVRLKKGKAILTKEFSKSRQHPTIRQLIATEAVLWIRLLKPIWLTNPVQLAKTHELTCEPFDLCIIDEASQILVETIVGSIERSRRIVIAGDQQQMTPSAYFQAGSQDHISALQHASYQFKNIQLRHHYRSKHAALIDFSNVHFYNHQLQVFPSFPILNECITRHFCEKGRFINRRNTEEAKKVSSLIIAALKTSKTIGVVAFSQEQLDEIWHSLDTQSKQKLITLVNENKAFMKPLEKVQGDECEHLIISLGYGKDENDRFQHRFGPLNQATGRNRLNVLFSRASEKIDFVCSITSTDLKWNTNSTLELLYKWLHQLEQQKAVANPISLPENMTIVGNSNKLIVTNTLKSYTDALELKTSYEVFTSRGWEIEYH